MKHLFAALFCLLILPGLCGPVAAQDEPVPTHYGLALLGGMTYDPDEFAIGLLQSFALIDYDRVFRHAAPEDLRLRVEANLGLADRHGQRAIASLNMLAFKYLDRYAAGPWRPYLEAGIGVIYTDFQVEDQGLRINFNPQAGAGVEYAGENGRTFQAGVRAHHISNGGLHEDNRGLNSVLLSVGWLMQ
jgi:hypothetical protein